MPCETTILRQVPFFALFDDDELTVLASEVELRTFATRQRIYKVGDVAGTAYVLVSGAVRVTTIDEDQQDVVFDEPTSGEFFGFASLLDRMPHQTTATALAESVCIEVHRDDIFTLVRRKPHAAMDMMAVLGRRLHAGADTHSRPLRAQPQCADRGGVNVRRAARRCRGRLRWLVEFYRHHHDPIDHLHSD